MTPKKWTLGELRSTLKSMLEESVPSAGWGKPKGRQRTTTIGAIFVPRPPTQEDTDAYPVEEVKHDA